MTSMPHLPPPVLTLTNAERERLAILIEEMGEAAQAAGKILRHGYDSQMDNRADLERELGDVYNSIKMLCHYDDVDEAKICARQEEKARTGKQWHHFQGDTK